MIFKTLEFKVGALIIGGLVLMSCLFMLVTENKTPFFKQTKTLWFNLNNASGLIKHGRVKMYGISVGTIDKIKLIENQAQIFIKVKKDLPITTSAEVQVVSDGILGDRYIEIFPGDPEDPILQDGGNIIQKRKSANISQVINLLSETFVSLKETSDSIKKILEFKDNDQGHRIMRNMILNTNSLIQNLKNFSERNINKIEQLVTNMAGVTKKLSEFAQVEGFENLENSLRNIDQITHKINQGEGTLGRLIYDNTTIEEINHTLLNVNEFLGDISQFKTSVDIHTEYLQKQRQYKSFLNLKIQPGLDRHYELQIINDYEGVVNKTTTFTSLDGRKRQKVEEEEWMQNRWKLSALYAKHFHDFVLKGGLIENSLGLGLDYHFLKKRMKMGIEIFDFDLKSTQLRAFLRLNLFDSIYLIGGGNHILNYDNKASVFFGAGLFFTNDDIKTLISKISF